MLHEVIWKNIGKYVLCDFIFFLGTPEIRTLG